MKEVKLGGGIQLTDNSVKVKFKKLSTEAVAPKVMKIGDAGADLTATSVEETAMYYEYGTGLAVEIPSGYVGYIFPRSSCSNYHLSLSNCVGVIDSNYRGEIKFRFKQTRDSFPTMTFEEVTDLSSSERGEAGYGSSGK
jgi:dUTP pyrophosphatase